MKLFTIGFTKSSAETFFGRLLDAGVQRVVDVRLNNVSQLSGFAKKDDLRYFLRAIAGIEYEHRSELAPTQQMLDDFKKRKGSWDEYEKKFLELMATRQVEKLITPESIDECCLLCSEDKPLHCHRRLVAEYLKGKWGNLEIAHL
jgi:uncharacterized protein (DUF488 family)